MSFKHPSKPHGPSFFSDHEFNGPFVLTSASWVEFQLSIGPWSSKDPHTPLGQYYYHQWWCVGDRGLEWSGPCHHMEGYNRCLVLHEEQIPQITLNTLGPGRNRRHFADDIFKSIFLNENRWISIKISLKFVPKGPINNIPALVQIMAWRRPGDKPSSEPMMISLPTHICVTRPQWVKEPFIFTKKLSFEKMKHYKKNIMSFFAKKASIHCW